MNTLNISIYLFIDNSIKKNDSQSSMNPGGNGREIKMDKIQS